MGKWDEFLKKQKDGNTNVYLNHFKKCHVKEFQKIQKTAIGNDDSSSEPPAKKKPAQIDHFFSEFSENGAKTMEIQRAVTQFISSAALPLSLVEHQGFKNLMRIAVPRFQLKSRSQFTRSDLPKLYEEYREKLKNSISAVENISVSFDCWTDSARKHEYMAFIGHFVEEDKPVYRILEVLDVSEKSHTGAFLAERMKSSIDYYGVDSKIRACVRDGAANAKCASDLICEVNFDCLAHKLNLAAKEGTSAFPGLEQVLAKLKKTCKAIRISSTLRREWEEIFDNLDSPVLMLKKHIDTRWTSLYDVLKRATDVREKLDCFLQESDDLDEITEAEWRTVQAIIDLLKPIDDAFQLVQAKDFTCSSIIPLCKSGFVKNNWKNQLLDIMLRTIEDTEESVPVENERQAESDPFARFLSSTIVERKKIPSDRKAVIVGEHDRWISEPTDSTLSPIVYWSLPQNQHAFPNLRFKVATYCPSIAFIERLHPLKIDSLKFSPHELVVNGTSYKLGTYRDYPPGVEALAAHQVDNRHEGVPYDLNQFGFADYSQDRKRTPGDVVIKDDDRFANWREEFTKKQVKRFEKQLEEYQIAMADRIGHTVGRNHRDYGLAAEMNQYETSEIQKKDRPIESNFNSNLLSS